MIPLIKNTFLNEYETKQSLASFIAGADRLSMGDRCSAFEQSFAIFQDRGDAVLFNSGGSANLALLQSLKNLGRIKDGDNIGFSSITWATNVMPIIQLGMIPIAVDCSLSTLNVMSGNLLDRLRDVDLNVMFITNVLGFAGDMDEIRCICKARKIILIEDNCEALGTRLSSNQCGNFGIASTFSFFVAHHLSTIEGGMVCTDDEELAEMLRMVRANGWDRNLTNRQQAVWRKKFNVTSEFQSKYVFYDLGYNLRPTEITGYLGLLQLPYLLSAIKARERNYIEIEKAMDADELFVIDHNHITQMSCFAIPIVCKTPSIKKKYLARFEESNIETRPIIAGNIQKQPFYRKYVKQLYNLSDTDFIHENCFYCGNYPELTEADLNVIKNAL